MRKRPIYRNHVYFDVGQEKLLEELDCVTIIKSIRKLRILTQLLLTKKQKFLIKFQRDNVIDSSSSGTSDEGQLNIIDLMKSKNEDHKKIINEKIEKNITGFNAMEIKGINMRVIKGIFKKRFSDDDYDDGEESDSGCNFESPLVSRQGKLIPSLIHKYHNLFDLNCDFNIESKQSYDEISGTKNTGNRLDTGYEFKVPVLFNESTGAAKNLNNYENCDSEINGMA